MNWRAIHAESQLSEKHDFAHSKCVSLIFILLFCARTIETILKCLSAIFAHEISINVNLCKNDKVFHSMASIDTKTKTPRSNSSERVIV